MSEWESGDMQIEFMVYLTIIYEEGETNKVIVHQVMVEYEVWNCVGVLYCCWKCKRNIYHTIMLVVEMKENI